MVSYILVDAFQGAGAFLSLLIILLRFEDFFKKQWIRMPVMGRMLTCQNGVIRMRLLVKLGLLVAVIVVMFLPYPFEVGGDFKVLPTTQMGVRAEVAGTIREIYIKENQLVRRGDTIAKLDDRLHRNRIAVLEASMEETQAMLSLRLKGAKPEEIAKSEQEVAAARKNLQYSEKEEQRYANMLREKAVPETEYQLARRKMDLDLESLKLAEKNLQLVKSGARDEEIKGLEAEMRRLGAEIAQAKGDLERTTLYSPLDGMVITPYLSQKIGQRLEAGDLLAVIEDRTTAVAEVEISENDIGEITPGAKVKFRTWADPTRTFSGELLSVAPVAYEKSWHRVERVLSEREQLIGQKEILKEKGKVIRVLCVFPEDAAMIKSDMTGYAKIESSWRPVGLAFTRWLFRFVYVEIWSWIP